MPPNTVDIPIEPEPHIAANGSKPYDYPKDPVPQENNVLKICQSSLSLVAHIFIGATVGISILFAFRNGLPLNSTSLHIVLCVIGYHLLMAEAILCLSTEGGWSSKLTLVQRRRAHTILQVAGSGLVIGGSIDMSLSKNVNFNTWHGIFGLIALVFSAVSLVNGLTSLYAFELRRILPGTLSKLTHICFGIIAFVAATVSLILGYQKNMFRNWATIPLTDVCIAFAVILTAIVIINPLITFYDKTKNLVKK